MISAADAQQLIPDIANINPLPGGGQKTVFSAQHSTYGPIVVKFMIAKNETEAARAEREVLAISQITGKCSNVPKIYEHSAHTLHGDSYLVILEQIIEGDNLEQIINSRNTLSLKDSVILLESLLSCCSILEEERLVHRDIKPANVIRDNDGKFWLIDFGIVRHLDLESVTDTGNLYGPHTPGYAPPEQFRSSKREVDSRSDLFSISMTVRTALTGTNPFTDGASNHLDVLRRTETLSLPVIAIQGDGQKQFSSLLNVMADRRISRRPRSCKEALGWLSQIKQSLAI